MFLRKCNIYFLIIARNVTTQSIRNARFKGNNPGVDRRLALLQTRNEEENDFDVEELEADFMSIGKSHKEHSQEIESLKEQVKFKIVGRKYFKQKFPNFLTWSDKEQIRMLYNKDPEEWSIIKLSEGFPASPEVIKHIVKSKWTPKSEGRIKNHDQSVSQNWKRFKNGQLDLPEDIERHIANFSKRYKNLDIKIESNNLEGNSLSIPERNKNFKGEFASIITSYYKIKPVNPLIITDARKPSTSVTNNNDTFILQDSKFNKETKYFTLPSLKSQLENDSKRKTISPEDEFILSKLSDNTNLVANNLISENLPIAREEIQDTKLKVVTVEQNIIPSYPEKIDIPKKAYKKGYTYKVDDCYYDSDGRFLYRVPGMS